MHETHQQSEANFAIVTADAVSKAFASRLVLDDVSISIQTGQSVCLCGINGAGKSTLLRIISGLLQPDKGAVTLCGYDVAIDPDKAKPRLGVISHKSMVYVDLTVFENLMFFANLYGVAEPAKRVEKLLEDVKLTAFRFDKASALSRGLLQRLSIARALVHGPEILLADEPFTGLDAESCKSLIAAFNDFVDGGGTILMTTHDVNMGLRCSSRVVVLDKRKIILDRMTDEIDTAEFAQDYLAFARSAN